MNPDPARPAAPGVKGDVPIPLRLKVMGVPPILNPAPPAGVFPLPLTAAGECMLRGALAGPAGVAALTAAEALFEAEEGWKRAALPLGWGVVILVGYHSMVRKEVDAISIMKC